MLVFSFMCNDLGREMNMRFVDIGGFCDTCQTVIHARHVAVFQTDTVQA
jgi:hypothetical protein